MISEGLYQELKAFVGRRVKNPADAEDIVHDVFVKVQSRHSQLREQEKLIGWIYRITRNSILDYYRRQHVALNRIYATEDNDDYNVFTDCVAFCITEMIDTLPSPYREALQQAELSNIPQKEIAVRLGISYSGLKSRVQRGREMLRKKMEKRYHIKTDGFGNVLRCEGRLPCGCNTTYM